MRIAVIPARGGSKRVPRKNIKPFAGRPVISYAVQAALTAGLFEHILVSTDDPEIAAVARTCGAEAPFCRPAELADDLTPTVPVIAHALDWCTDTGWDVEEACCIYPTVPLLQADDLRQALTLLHASGCDYAFPVAEFPSAIQRALRRLPDGRVEPFDPAHVRTRSQDLEPGYYDAGQFYWGRADAWRRRLDIHPNGATIVLPRWRVADIDTPEDWRHAELLYRAAGLDR